MLVGSRRSNRYDGIDERVVAIIRAYARRLKYSKTFDSMDVEDLEQELMCDVIASLKNFDNNSSKLEHFTRKVIKRSAIDLIRLYARKKRNALLSQPVTYNDSMQQYEELERKLDLVSCTKKLPVRYQLLCQLRMSSYSLEEISKIVSLSRSTITRIFKKIATILATPNIHCTEDAFFGVFNMNKNLSVVEKLSVKELSDLEIYDLAELNEQVAILLKYSKELKEKMDAALEVRYSDVVKNNLSLTKKDTGTTHFIERGFQITAEISKKVIWDSDKIRTIIKEIPEEKAREIVKAVYSIDERKYLQLSREEQKLFEEARTVIPGRTRFKISAPASIQPHGGGHNHNENYNSRRAYERTHWGKDGHIWSVWYRENQPTKDVIRTYNMHRFRSGIASGKRLGWGFNCSKDMGRRAGYCEPNRWSQSGIQNSLWTEAF